MPQYTPSCPAVDERGAVLGGAISRPSHVRKYRIPGRHLPTR